MHANIVRSYLSELFINMCTICKSLDQNSTNDYVLELFYKEECVNLQNWASKKCLLEVVKMSLIENKYMELKTDVFMTKSISLSLNFVLFFALDFTK